MQFKISNYLLVSCFCVLISCNQSQKLNEFKPVLIPQPQKIVLMNGNFKLNKKTRLIIEDKSQTQAAEYFTKYIEKASGWNPEISLINTEEKNVIYLKHSPEIKNEAYTLDVQNDKITINASFNSGYFYAFQTLRQLLDCSEEQKSIKSTKFWNIPLVYIEDSPAFPWRGFMLDVSRHFIPKEDVLRLIDNLSFHKINTFHLHLVDDQGWRVEIKKHPKLTEIGGWRINQEDKPWNSRPNITDSEKPKYGGFYTQDDIREMVEYARKRQITIVPEIEMPAHVTSALAAYPQFSCTGGPFTVPSGGLWPITDIYCAGKDSTFLFLEDILTEVLDLFPSKYIHIGGDEATKTEWEKCPDCRKRIKTEKLKNTEELQSYFIKRIEKFINSKDRILIGWDEILEGGLPPKATVMSWRGIKGGIEAAKQGHDVVMTPGNPCYFDHYQGPMDQEPLAIGGNNTLAKVYNFNPVPEELTAEESKHILGGQANLWTEYVPDFKHVEYMTFPRIAALAEALWSSSETKNWDSFSKRIGKMMERYEKMGINYSKSAWKITAKATCDTIKKQLAVTLNTELANAEIRYTTDGSEPTINSDKYEKEILINNTTQVNAASFNNGIQMEKSLQQTFNINKATVKPLKYLNPYSEYYKGSGYYSLVNGIRGTKNHSDGEWQAWNGQDMEVVIDLQEKIAIGKISVGTLQNAGSWIFFPKSAEFYVSKDGIKFEKVADVKNELDPLDSQILIKDFESEFTPIETQFIKICVRNLGVCPKGHSGEGKAAWLFADEIKIE